MVKTEVVQDLKCYHCGESCDDALWLDDHPFCCTGCKTVYEILNSNDLCEYYNFDQNPGIQLKNISDETYAYLDEREIRKRILDFDSETFAKVTYFIPAIHCVSCIWLLENLSKLDKGILHSEVNFIKKTVSIDFNPLLTQPGNTARLLASLGYIPKITLDGDESLKTKKDHSLILKLVIAGFCFGNVMLFSFPEYLGIDHTEKELTRVFSFLNLALSIPVFFYSGADYLRSAFKSFRQKQINIDVPIAAGLVALFLRSTYDIVTATGAGYFDSFTGLVFFLLVGRWFQGKTYESLSFDRDFTAYFPLAVNVIEEEESKPVVIYKLKKGDRIRIRNMEIVPADSFLLNESALIDYSFVTGESRSVNIRQGELIYAGGRLVGTPVELIVEKATSQSHLTSLWNNETFRKIEESKYQKIIDRAARIFTWVVLGIALVTGIYWQITSPSEVWLVLTSVLMVACPCALALSAPFTMGSMLRVFGKNKLYLKNADVIERMAAVDAIVFDKTGTVTHGTDPEVTFVGDLGEDEMNRIALLTSYSTHPLSMIIAGQASTISTEKVSNFIEFPGKGLQGTLGRKSYKIGSARFVGFDKKSDENASHVYVSIDDDVKGYFRIKTVVRKKLKEMIYRLGEKCTALLSGDREAGKGEIQKLFPSSVPLLFNQSPHDKLQYVKALQSKGKKVMMIGDGLNDAGALKQSDVGIAVTDDTGVFTPACDGILSGDKIASLDKMLKLSKSSTIILKVSFVISFIYNAIALSFAVTGHLTPLIAAIIMPLSSISVVGFSTSAVNFVARRIKM